MNRKLFRTPHDVMIAGVCGGLGKYLEINPAFVRAFFVLLALANGIGFWVYVVLWAVIPREDCGPNPTLGKTANDAANEMAEKARMMGDELRQAVNRPHPHTVAYIGAALIVFGVITLLTNLNPALLGWLNSGFLWALLLIVAGIFLLLRSRKL
jgi:phage shock protein PspC (stress-responsive transcriptional regulator)